jgi:predicted enzyme related to lactoylglutathione lyase
MEKVLGIGGVFFRSDNPSHLIKWYQTHLGVDAGQQFWHQSAGNTVFCPFQEDSDYFPQDRRWMINFRVADLDAMIAQLVDAGIAVETRAEWNSELGRFARIHDPEGNPIELWEPGEGY